MKICIGPIKNEICEFETVQEFLKALEEFAETYGIEIEVVKE